MNRNVIEGQQQYLSVTTAEAYTMAHNAPEGATFMIRLYVELVNEEGKPIDMRGRANMPLTREIFEEVVLRLIDGDQEVEGARIPLTKQVWETGETVYWIG